MSNHRLIQALLMVASWDGVDIVDIFGRDNRGFIYVSEQRYLSTRICRERIVCPTQDNVRLNADAAQLFYGMLGWLCLDFPRLM